MIVNKLLSENNSYLKIGIVKNKHMTSSGKNQLKCAVLSSWLSIPSFLPSSPLKAGAENMDKDSEIWQSPLS